MEFFKMAAVGAATMIGAGVQASVQRPVPGTTRLQITCNLIKKNVEEGTTENSLHPRSIYYKVINRMNFFINKLSTPPPAEYLFVTVGSGVLSVENSGTDVVLSRFPDEGQNLMAFGLTPSAIKSIALPNDLQEWPISALTNCTALEKITAFGEEVDTPLITVVRTHFEACTNLKHIQIPSSVTIGNGTADSSTGSVFPHTLQSVIFPASTRSIGYCSFYYCRQLTSIDLSRCEKLTEFIDLGNYGAFEECTSVASLNMAGCKSLPLISRCAFYNFLKLSSINLSGCTNLQTIGYRAFFGRPATEEVPLLSVIVLPPSLQALHLGAFGYIKASVFPNLRTIIWKGRSTRPPIVNEDYPTSGISYRAFSDVQTLDDLVADGTITEIFVP